MPEIPLDVNREWLPVIRRLQSIAKSNGLSVISINVLVDASGIPVAWTEPSQVKIEPKNSASALIQLALTNGLMTRK